MQVRLFVSQSKFCVTGLSGDSERYSSRTAKNPICDTHGGAFVILCIRVARTQKYSVSARGHTRNKLPATGEVAA